MKSKKQAHYKVGLLFCIIHNTATGLRIYLNTPSYSFHINLFIHNKKTATLDLKVAVIFIALFACVYFFFDFLVLVLAVDLLFFEDFFFEVDFFFDLDFDLEDFLEAFDFDDFFVEAFCAAAGE